MRLFIRLFQACLIVAAAAFARPDKLVGQTSGNSSPTIKIGLINSGQQLYLSYYMVQKWLSGLPTGKVG